MDKTIRGKAYVVGDNIDTDQIIPAKYLSYNPADAEERKYFGMYAMSGVPDEAAGLPDGDVAFTPDGQFESEFAVIIGGRNFGCGSSREHAPLAIAEAGCQAVVAESFARIFYRNSVNGGYVVPLECETRLIEAIRTGDEVELEVGAGTLTHVSSGPSYKLTSLGDVGPIIEAGGIFAYARQTGMLSGGAG